MTRQEEYLQMQWFPLGWFVTGGGADVRVELSSAWTDMGVSFLQSAVSHSINLLPADI